MTTQAYYLPQSVGEAVGLLAEHGPALLVMAGGTIAMPLINEGISLPEKVMGLRRAGMDTISRSNPSGPTGGALKVGATVTLTQMLAQPHIPLLAQAAHHVGGWAIRNMGTVGGNLFAPPPAGDLAVALLSLDAQLKLVSAALERSVPLGEFYTGFMATALAPGELVAEIEVPLPAGVTAYAKCGRRHANTPAVVSVAAHLVLDGPPPSPPFQRSTRRVGGVRGVRVIDARLALNGVGPHPMRATRAEQVLIGATLDEAAIAAAAAAAAEECEPFSDAVASAWYRRKMVGVYVRRALAQLAA